MEQRFEHLERYLTILQEKGRNPDSQGLYERSEAAIQTALRDNRQVTPLTARRGDDREKLQKLTPGIPVERETPFSAPQEVGHMIRRFGLMIEHTLKNKQKRVDCPTNMDRNEVLAMDINPSDIESDIRKAISAYFPQLQNSLRHITLQSKKVWFEMNEMN